MFRSIVSVAAAGLMTAGLSISCAATPEEEPFQANRVEIGSGQELAVDQLVVLVDTSASIDRLEDFPYEKANVRSFVEGMPDGSYEASTIVFGGSKRDVARLSSFNRAGLAAHAAQMDHLGSHTPLDEAILEAAAELEGTSGNAALVIYSDFVPTIFGTPRDPAKVEAAFETLKAGHEGPVCVHTVQTGGDASGASLALALTEMTDCGTTRSFASIDSPTGMYAFQQELFVGAAALPAVAAGDSDGDGVLDHLDACPDTPAGADVDARGCWIVGGIEFGSDSVIPDEGSPEIDEVAEILRQNPDIRVRIDGHTDSTGPAAYNMDLSQRRADNVRANLIGSGIDPDRIETRGFGEDHPVASNETREGRHHNRRVEVTLLP